MPIMQILVNPASLAVLKADHFLFLKGNGLMDGLSEIRRFWKMPRYHSTLILNSLVTDDLVFSGWRGRDGHGWRLAGV